MAERGQFDRKWLAYVLAAPQLLLMALFFYWPAGQALAWSIRFERPFGGSAAFAGLSNFTALFRDSVFLDSLMTSALFTGCATGISIGIALALAVAASRRLPHLHWLSGAFIWPYAVAAPAAGVIMELLLDSHIGLAAILNDWCPGIWSPVLNGTDAFLMVTAAFVWLHVPFNFVFLLAGLNAVPQSCLDAAAIDGAGPWRQLAGIRLPLLRPYLLFVLTLDVTESFTQSFGIIDATTQGGPGGATNILVYNIYSDGFVGLDFSRASAESVLMIAIMAIILILQFRWFDRQGQGRAPA